MYVNSLDWVKKNTVPGFHKISIFDVFTFLLLEIKNNDINTRASAISYSFFVALFPSLIFIFTLTAYLPNSIDFFTTLENSILSLLPEKAGDYLWKDIISGLRPRAETSILSVGFILAVFFASDGIMSLMRGFDKTYKTSFRKRSWYEKQAVALFLTFLIAILLIISVVIIILGAQIFKWIFGIFHLTTLNLISLKILQYGILLVLFYMVFSSIYRFGPALRVPIKGFSPGTVFATITSILSSIIFAYFVDHFGNYHKVYGTISALLITLIWIRINVMIIILGFELNAAIIVNRDIRALLLKEELEEDDFWIS